VGPHYSGMRKLKQGRGLQAVAVWLLAVMSSLTARAHEGAMDSPATATSLFPLFITCDLKDEFLTQSIDAHTVMWFDTPVSIEGSRALRDAAQQNAGKIVPVPLVLDVRLDRRRASAHMTPIERGVHANKDCAHRVASGTRQP